MATEKIVAVVKWGMASSESAAMAWDNTHAQHQYVILIFPRNLMPVLIVICTTYLIELACI